MGLTLRERYADSIGEMMKHSTASAKIDETKVYEEANMVTITHAPTMGVS